MLDKIRLATQEEVKEIEKVSNLTPRCSVWKMGEITGVWRLCNELDPVIRNGASDRTLWMFLWGMENMMRGAGATEYYYNVDASDTVYHTAIETHLGGERLSRQPDYRYRVNL
jgi:hypothetical protein